VKRPRSIPWAKVWQTVRSDWALRYRLADQPANITIDGVKLRLGEWATPEVRGDLYSGYYEHTERHILRETLKPTDRYLELGAGIGLITACACRIVGPDNVTAFEADPRIAAAANDALQHNGLPALVKNAMLGSTDGEADFFVHPEFWRSTATPVVGNRQIRVPQRSLTAVLREYRPTYLMLDIEGGEIEVLGAAPPAHVRAVCVEVHPQITGEPAIQDLLAGMIAWGFRLDLMASRERVVYFDRG
jgi:FkbM family methyltransferase